MTRIATTSAAILIVCSTIAGVPKASAQSFSVKDFGAKGDGQTDDTRAIQAALDAAGKRVHSELEPGAAYFFASPEVRFPIGKYMLSDTLKINFNLVGEGGAILYQTKPDKDVIHHSYSWRWSASGLTFVGGNIHFDLGNPNIDSGKILIEKCSFYKSGGPAIRMRKGSNSTQVCIRDCTFIACRQALINTCDLTKLSDSWISTSKLMKNSAAIENYGILLMENVCGVPLVDHGADQRWIDNHAGVTCRNVRFGGEDAGLPAVVNFAKYTHQYPVIPTFVILENCHLYGLGNPKRKAAIFCEELPNQIVVRGCNGMVDLPVIQLGESVKARGYLEPASKNPDCLRFHIGRDNFATPAANLALPDLLRPYQVANVAGELRPTAAGTGR